MAMHHLQFQRERRFALRLSCSVGILASLLGSGLHAAQAPGTSAPDLVTVGIFVNQINSIDLRANTFTVDFHIWFRWKGNLPDPLESFDIVDGRIELRGKPTVNQNGAEKYSCCRIVAVVTRFWVLGG